MQGYPGSTVKQKKLENKYYFFMEMKEEKNLYSCLFLAIKIDINIKPVSPKGN